MNFNKMYPSKYLKKEDIERPMTATIESLTIETVGQDENAEEKPILHFAGTVKPMVLNKTNGFVLCQAFGEETSAWIGRSVELYVDPNVQYKGKRVGGLALRLPANGGGNGFSFWEWPQAQAEAAKVGITREQLIQRLKEAGSPGYKPSRDTAMVKAMIAAVNEPEQPFDLAPPPGSGDASEVPF